MKKLIYLYMFLFMVSCQKEPFNELSHTFIIKEGNHRDEKEPPVLVPAKDEIEGFIYLDPSMLAEEGFVSKLVGISGLHNYKNSARLGWRTVGDKIELVTYVYNDGQTPQENPEELKKSLGLYTAPAQVYFKIYYAGGNWHFQVDETLAKVPGEMPTLKYISMPWYGGVPSAPHDITVKIIYKL